MVVVTSPVNPKSIFFADDNIIANKKYAIELFRALQPYRLNWSCQASINISKEEDLLRLMKDSGCGSILIGLESVSSQNLTRMNKRLNLIKIFPRLFDRHVRLSTVLTLMAYNEFAYTV